MQTCSITKDLDRLLGLILMKSKVSSLKPWKTSSVESRSMIVMAKSVTADSS